MRQRCFYTCCCCWCCSVAKVMSDSCYLMDYSTPSSSFTNSQSLLKFMSFETVMLSNHLILCHPFLLLPSIFPIIRFFSNELALCIGDQISELQHQHQSFQTDWFDLLAVQEILKSLLQHHSSKASVLQCSAFFMVQLLQPYMTTGKETALTVWTSVS